MNKRLFLCVQGWKKLVATFFTCRVPPDLDWLASCTQDLTGKGAVAVRKVLGETMLPPADVVVICSEFLTSPSPAVVGFASTLLWHQCIVYTQLPLVEDAAEFQAPSLQFKLREPQPLDTEFRNVVAQHLHLVARAAADPSVPEPGREHAGHVVDCIWEALENDSTGSARGARARQPGR